jgi:phenylpropionate dioxygenase-like ring-hydroxylating dioxygenase large terminal subunit
MKAAQQKVTALTTNQNRRSPVLADGATVESLIDRDKREVATRVMSDPDIYQLELERIWAKTWIIVGHESEIPNAGDFITRRVADDPVIIVRRRDGQIDCLLNVCPHRGAVVCRAESGNGQSFRCIYHGWMFNLDGSFRGAPFKEELFSDCLDPPRMSLRRARVGVSAGIIFVNWDESAPSLEEHLGDFKYYFNVIFNRTRRGLEVLGPPQRFVINANWKTAAEQFGGDGYHAGQLHRSLGAAIGANMSDPAVSQMLAPKVSTDNGHNIICFDLGNMFRAIAGGKELSVMEKLGIMPPPGVPRELLPEIVAQFNEEELHLLATTPPSNGGMFPNVGIWNTYGPLPDGSVAPFISFRTYVPLGVDKFEFCMWVLVARDASEEYREVVRRATSFTQGAAGFVEGDDGEIWPGQSTASRGYIARQSTLKYWALAGDHPPEGWSGGGHVHTGFSKDDSQWAWWTRYFNLMTNSA